MPPGNWVVGVDEPDIVDPHIVVEDEIQAYLADILEEDDLNQR